MKKQNNEKSLWQTLTWRQQTQILLFWLVLIAVVMGIGSSIENGVFNWRSLGGNLATELIGGVLTFFVFQYVLDKRDNDALKARLLRELGSGVNPIVRMAAVELNAYKWWCDGSLVGRNFTAANWDEINLMGANLESVNLESASVQKADLRSVNMRDSELDRCNFRGSDLTDADLREAMLQEANFENAFLDGADLRGAYLKDANLINIHWQGATLPFGLFDEDDSISFAATKFDETTLLPDETLWTPATDMGRFTDPTHADFWQPEWVKKQKNQVDTSNS